MFTVYPPFGASLCVGFHMTLQRIGFVCESCWGSCTTSFGRVMSVLCWEPRLETLLQRILREAELDYGWSTYIKLPKLVRIRI